MLYLNFDTETTGIPDYNLDLTDPTQPHIVQLGLVLCDAEGNELEAHKVPIKPEGYEIDERPVGDNGKKTAFAIHGLTNDFLQENGVPLREALELFRSLEEKAVLKIAYGYRFDGFLIKAAHARAGIEPLSPAIDKYCAMKGIADVRGTKWPKLVEIYKELTGKTLEGAHDALEDARACKEVFIWILKNGVYKPQPRFVPGERAA